ncbi:MAG: VOC family protein [Acidimicrobiales bacterium]
MLFEGNCAEAMTFYQRQLGGTLILTTVSETPMKDQLPENLHQKVAYAKLQSGAIAFSATDWLHPTRVAKPGNTAALYVSGGTYGELREIFDKLAENADADLLDDLRDMPFGTYGHLADQYGVHWFFQGQPRD